MSTKPDEILGALFEYFKSNMPNSIEGIPVKVDYGQNMNTDKLIMWAKFQAFSLLPSATRDADERADGTMQWDFFYKGTNVNTWRKLANEVYGIFDSEWIETENYRFQIYEPDMDIVNDESNYIHGEVTLTFIARAK